MMYLIFGLIFLILLLFLLIGFRRKREIIRRVRRLGMEEKCDMLNQLIRPLGYSYVPSQDIFTTRTDAWQKEFGYCALYDRSASLFHMIFDCLPVYFDYDGVTWLIEFWKGQYGINAGCEIGVYHAGRLLRPEERSSALFEGVENARMPRLSLRLLKDGEDVARLHARHWWLTAFIMGNCSRPESLTLRACLALESPGMARAFAAGLRRAGYPREKICVCRNTVSFSFIRSLSDGPGLLGRLQRHFAQACNRFWCRVYLRVTRPFSLSMDRLLYLYYYLPFAFRRMIRVRRFGKKR